MTTESGRQVRLGIFVIAVVLLLPDGVEDLWSQDYLDLITLA